MKIRKMSNRINEYKYDTIKIAVVNKKRHVYIFFITMMIIGFIVACSNGNNYLALNSNPKVYLLNAEMSTIEPIDLNLDEIIDVSNKNAVIEYAILLLRNGVSSSKLEQTIPDSIIIRNYSIDDMNVTLNFETAYYNLSLEQEIFLRSSVIKTLTSFKSFESVEFFVNGVPLILNDNIKLGRQYSSDVLLSFDEATLHHDDKTVIIYYPNKDKDKLVATYVDVKITPTKKMEEIILERIIDSKNGIYPSEVRLLNVYTHEGTCFVDFSKEFQKSFLPKGISERIAIYSLVNSLTELSTITTVQILVEGEITSTFQGRLSLDRMFTKNYSLIEY